MYHMRPNKFLEDHSCLDCKTVVTEMSSTGPRQKAVVFYCDEGIKGFGAPQDDPMKDELTCDLLLCLGVRLSDEFLMREKTQPVRAEDRNVADIKRRFRTACTK
jgi:hypothetical protein